MRKLQTPFFVLVLLLCGHVPGRASHLYGADFFYEHLTGNTYKLTLVVYGDCSGTAFPNLANSSPQVDITENDTFRQSTNLFLTGIPVEVTPVCPAQINNTSCNGGSIPGVKRFIYSNTVTIGYPSSSWVFRFTGAMSGSTSSAGRSNSITNIVFGNNGGSVMALEALLDNTTGPNSSPQFTTIPTPFYCVNVPQQYNQGAIDPDNDNLVYSLVPGLEPGGIVQYQSGYNATHPLSTASNNFSFNSLNGQMTFTPDIIQKALVVNSVLEYRNGLLVGSASREMTFVVLGSCNIAPVSGNIDTNAASLQGGLLDTNKIFNVCEGTANVHLSILPSTTLDTVSVTINGLPAGATANVINNNTPYPVVQFNWNTVSVPMGVYTFFITYKNNSCPLSSQQTQAFTVRVFRPNEMTTLILAPTQCAHKAKIQYNFTYGILPRQVTIKQGATVIQSFTDNTGLRIDSLAAGTYTVIITSPHIACPTQYTVQIADSGQYPYPPVTAPVFYCKDDTPLPLPATPVSGAVVKWYDAFGNYFPGTPIQATNNTGIFIWLASQFYNVCESRKDTVKVYVTKRPIASIDASPQLCTVDTTTINFNGSIGIGPILSYLWNFDGATTTSGQNGGPWRVNWKTPGIKKITLQVLENQCPSGVDTQLVLVKPTPVASFTYNDICRYDSVKVRYDANAITGQAYAWDFDGADIAASNDPGPFLLHWESSGPKDLSLVVSLDGCADTFAHGVKVFPAPDANFENVPGTVCLGDKIYLKATGGTTYQWLPKDKVRYDPDGSPFTFIMAPVTYTVIAGNEYGCIDSDKITYTDVEPCCNFSYPNAFTPNGDGLNDIFRVILYGNKESFELSIYNRWGQRVFVSYDPKVGWDGSAFGKPCDPGTYFYYLKARCLTGHDEEHKGDVQLIR